MKQDPEYFEGKEPVLIYIAKKLKDALRLEEIFAETGIDYGVEADEYRGGVIFRSVRAGAFFYVLPETVDAAHEIMRVNNYKPISASPRRSENDSPVQPELRRLRISRHFDFQISARTVVREERIHGLQ